MFRTKAWRAAFASLATLAIAISALAVALSITPSASATTAPQAAYPNIGGWNLCPDENASGVLIIMCVYPDANGIGSPYLIGNAGGCQNMTGGMINHGSSIISQSWSGYVVKLYADANCSEAGGYGFIYPAERWNFPYSAFSDPGNDDLESWQIMGTNENGESETGGGR